MVTIKEHQLSREREREKKKTDHFRSSNFMKYFIMIISSNMERTNSITT